MIDASSRYIDQEGMIGNEQLQVPVNVDQNL